MRYIQALIFSFALPYAASSHGVTQKEVSLDKLIAEVDRSPIFASEVTEKLKSDAPYLLSDYPATPKDTPSRRALYDLINQKLVFNKAADLDIMATDADVEAQISQILENNPGLGGSRKNLEASLKSQGKSLETFKADLKQGISIMKFKGRVITPRVKITDKDVDAYYLKLNSTKGEALEFQMRQILIPLPREATPKDLASAIQNAQSILKQLEGGSSFDTLQESLSQDKDKAHKTYRYKDLLPELQVALKDLAEGNFSKPVKSPLGVHIFWVLSKKLTGGQALASERRKLEFELREQENKKQLIQWLEDARRRAKVRIHD